MFRRQVLRQTRSISSQLATRPQYTQTPAPFKRIQPYIQFHRSITSTDRRRQEAAAEAQNSTPSDGPPPAAEAENPLKKVLEAKNKEIIDLKDKYLRSVADFRNLQDRTKRDIDNSRQFAIQRFAQDLLDSIDNLDRAITSVPSEAIGKSASPASSSDTTTGTTSSFDPNAQPTTDTTALRSEPDKDLMSLYNGLKMTETILMGTLKKHGLERFDPLEEGKVRKFDPNSDEAMFMTPMEGKENGDVIMTQSKGFMLNGRVVRPAKVGVVRNS